MDVSMPITTVVPSLDGPVLAALAGTSGAMELGVLHDRAGRGSRSGVRSVLLRMVEVGLVLGRARTTRRPPDVTAHAGSRSSRCMSPHRSGHPPTGRHGGLRDRPRAGS